MPNTPSILNERVYQALRKQGMSKTRAARISNAQAHKDADAGASLHGPGGLLSTPGMGVRKRKGRKWGMKLKDKLITGNLYRSETGRFAGPGGSPSATAKPRKGAAAKKPKQTPEQRSAARQAQHQANSANVAKQMAANDTGLSPSGSTALLAFAQGTPPDPRIAAGLAQMGLAEQATDGSYRMTPTGRAAVAAMQAGDYQRAVDAVSRGTDAAGKRTQRATAATARQAAATARREQVRARREAAAAAKKKKPAKAGGGKKTPAKAAPKPTAPKPAAPKPAAPKPAAPSSSGGGSSGGGPSAAPKPAPKPPAAAKPTLSPALRDAASALSEGADVTPAEVQQLVTNGLVKLDKNGKPILTAAGLRATMKAETYGGVKRSNLDDSIFAGPDRSFPIKTAQDVRDAVQSLGRTKHDKDAVKRGIIRRAKAIGAMDALPESWRAKSFTVYKDASGQHRWIARTTTAYKDRDGEIISEAALDADSLRMTASKQFGPLRYWHVGQPDPFDEQQPWGPGLDIGDCDYSVVIGRTRIESGTFRSSAIAQKMAQAADRHEMSPGFFHPLDQPDSGGVFNSMRSFERSVVPIKYGRASNLFTGFTVKEFRMDVTEMERRFKAMYQELGLTPEQGAELGQQLVATEKAATVQGIAFKSDDTPDDYPDLEINGVVYKAFPPKAAAAAPMDAEDDPAMGGDMGVDEDVEGEPPIDDSQPAGDYIGDMSWDEFSAKLTELLAPVLKMQDMHKGMTDALGEMKAMYGGVATKDDARAQELATLKSTLAELTAKIAQIEGDQPNTILPDEVEAALKSDGPAKPQEPEKKQIVSTPERPWMGWGAQTFPELYQNGENT